MAVVYLARDLKHDRWVAIKVLRPEFAASLAVDRFLREIVIAARLQHPHILPLYDSGACDDLLFYVMPYVEGETLHERLHRDKQLPLEQAIQIACEVADALGCAHAHDVVHRDIKPENILLTGGHAVVADFGVARALSAASTEPLTDSGVVIGTPAYMSPEQGAGAVDVDGRTDIYALGCVLYEMLAAEPPFTGPTPQAVIARHISAPIPSLVVLRPTVPVKLQRIVEKALAKVPADRFATAAEFTEALSRVGEMVRAEGGAAGRRPRAVAWTAGLIVLAAAWLVWRALVRPAPTSAPEPALDPAHVAILYFSDNSEGQRALHIANGFTEALIDNLRGIEGLEVRSPYAVRAYSSGAMPVDSVARVLGVGTVVEGSIARSGDRLRVTARLVDGASGSYLDSRTIERPAAELFALLDELGTQVGEFVRQRLGTVLRMREQRRRTESIEAWELLQRAEAERRAGEELRGAGDIDAAALSLVRSDSLLVRAHAADRDWREPLVLRGWLALERAALMGAQPSLEATGRARVVEEMQRAVTYAERALRLEPSNPDALELRGTARYRLWDSVLREQGARVEALRDSAETDLRAAIVTHPWPAGALSTLSDLVRRKGDFREARRLAEEAVAQDEFLTEAREVTFRLAQALLDAEEVTEAMQVCDHGQSRFPFDARFPTCALTALAAWPALPPDVVKAWRLAGSMVERSPPADRGLYRTTGQLLAAAVVARAGLGDSARATLQRARSIAPAEDPRARLLTYYEAAAWLKLGEPDSALRALEAYLQLRPQRRTYLAKDWWFRELWADSRYQALVRGTR